MCSLRHYWSMPMTRSWPSLACFGLFEYIMSLGSHSFYHKQRLQTWISTSACCVQCFASQAHYNWSWDSHWATYMDNWLMQIISMQGLIGLIMKSPQSLSIAFQLYIILPSYVISEGTGGKSFWIWNIYTDHIYSIQNYFLLIDSLWVYLEW